MYMRVKASLLYATGGKHRSITFTELVSDYLIKRGLRVQKSHRDIGKDISYYRT